MSAPSGSAVPTGSRLPRHDGGAAQRGSRQSGQPRQLGQLIREALLPLSDPGRGLGRIDVGFFARALVQATMPHSDPGTNEFVRRNGYYTLSMMAPAEVGLPYGRYPRLVLAYLATEAVRRKTRMLELDACFSDFCGRLGVTPTSGPRGTMTLVREQLQRLFASSFQCIYHVEGAGRHAGDGFVVAEKRCLWWDPRRGEAGLGRGSFVVLSERFFDEVSEAPVPLDLRVLRALRSPFEIDIYVWLSWRFFRLRQPVTIPWRLLMLQFGCGYANPRHFKQRFLRYLKSVIRYYPAARLTPTQEGLVLRPSAPHVEHRSATGQMTIAVGG